MTDDDILVNWTEMVGGPSLSKSAATTMVKTIGQAKTLEIV